MKKLSRTTYAAAGLFTIFAVSAAVTFALEVNLPDSFQAMTDYVLNDGGNGGGNDPASVKPAAYTDSSAATDAAAVAFDASKPALSTPETIYSPGPVSGTKFGMFYLFWHCLAQPENWNIEEAIAGIKPIGPIGEFHWWGKPALGYYCATRNREVLRTHATQLRDAGIDFVFVDVTNFEDTGATAQAGAIEPLKALLEEWSNIPGAPKVVVWLPITATATLPTVIDQILSGYPKMLFPYQGKPLMLVVDNPDHPPAQPLIDQWSAKYTTRRMWAFNTAPTTWSFLEPCQGGFKASGGTLPCQQKVTVDPAGNIEQVSVVTAYQSTFMSNISTATPKFNGATFAQQMKRVDEYPNAPIVTITGWNEWIAQRYCIKDGMSTADCNGASDRINGNYVFVDQYDAEYNRDIEPGGPKGDQYYKQLIQEVLGRKQKNSRVIGYIDEARANGAGAIITGWACTTGYPTSIPVDLYIDGPADQGGEPITRASANLGNEEAVGSICADGSVGTHRFSISLTAAQATKYAGHTIYVHGISPIGRENLLLGHSGEIALPGTAAPGTIQAAVATRPLYRFYAPDGHRHFITASYSEGLGTGWTYEGQAFKILDKPSPEGTIPIYRCFSNGNFVSNDPKCEGQRVEGLYGYLFKNPGPNRQAVHRIYNHAVLDHLITFNANEGKEQGYVDEGVLGYAE